MVELEDTGTMHDNPERIIEEQLEKEHQLKHEVRLLNKQVHQLEQEL